jgi:hypothetical protein
LSNSAGIAHVEFCSILNAAENDRPPGVKPGGEFIGVAFPELVVGKGLGEELVISGQGYN